MRIFSIAESAFALPPKCAAASRPAKILLRENISCSGSCADIPRQPAYQRAMTPTQGGA